jgi:hypothetical protein
MADGAGPRRAVVAALLLAGALGVFALVRTGQTPPTGPVPVPFDRVRCARCGMLVSDPGFAGQIQTSDGQVLYFDDPGCVLLHAHEHSPEELTLYFRHMTEDRWLTVDEVRFVPAESTPMEYGLGAAMRGITPDEAVAEVLKRERARRSP